jgi:hypothetical protein
VIIFLDFDGVITHVGVHKGWYDAPTEVDNDGTAVQRQWYDLDRNCIKLLNRLVELTNAKVVISSTWRTHHELRHLENHMKNFGFEGEVIDKTPHKMSLYWRDEEINLWMVYNNYTDDYLILDDESHHLENAPSDHFVYIYEGWDKGGLTSTRAKEELTELLKQRGIEWDHSF